MDGILDDMQEYAAAYYLDDIVFFGKTWQQHISHLELVLNRLQETGLTLKLKKCQLGMQECTFLGHVVGLGNIAPEKAKIQAVQDFNTPKTKQDVRSFLGLSGYYRRFIPAFSASTAVLSDLTRKMAPAKVIWTEECNRAFKTLKQQLSSHPVLASPDYTQPFIIQTDASDRNKDDTERPVAYYSRKLYLKNAGTPPQKRSA